MITEANMPLEVMKKRMHTHKCGVCGSELTVAWGGAFGFNGYILRCGVDKDHDTITDYIKPSKEYEEGLKLWRSKKGMDTNALMTMDKTKMMTRIGQAKFPKDLTPVEQKLLCEVAISYGFDPLMQELMVYQGNPYVTINGRYRKAQETGKFDGIDTRPATEAERKARNAKTGDFLYRCEAWRNDASHAFVGWGRVLEKETHGSEHLPVVKDPDRQAEKRAEAMALRKAFSLPAPMGSWEEAQEERAGETDNAIEVKGAVIPEEDKIPDPLEPAESTGDDPDKNRSARPEEITSLKQAMADKKKDMNWLGEFCNAKNKWNIKDLPDLKYWQLEILFKELA